jgi:hypothetical protein
MTVAITTCSSFGLASVKTKIIPRHFFFYETNKHEPKVQSPKAFVKQLPYFVSGFSGFSGFISRGEHVDMFAFLFLFFAFLLQFGGHLTPFPANYENRQPAKKKKKKNPSATLGGRSQKTKQKSEKRRSGNATFICFSAPKNITKSGANGAANKKSKKRTLRNAMMLLFSSQICYFYYFLCVYRSRVNCVMPLQQPKQRPPKAALSKSFRYTFLPPPPVDTTAVALY